MKIAADFHFHLYPCYAARKAIETCARNLFELDPGGAAIRAAFLAEPRGSRLFEELAERSGLPAAKGIAVRGVPGQPVLEAVPDGCPPFYLFAGRQIVTREKLEILALCLEADGLGGVPAAAVIAEILDRGGVPVLCWAPGKWLFERGRAVSKIIKEGDPARLFLGDSSLRPCGTPEPSLFRAAARRGYRILAGSDPLPFPGEEARAGSFGTVLESGMDFDRSRPADSLTRWLAVSETTFRRAGRRSGPLTAAVRLWRHARTKRNAAGKTDGSPA